MAEPIGNQAGKIAQIPVEPEEGSEVEQGRAAILHGRGNRARLERVRKARDLEDVNEALGLHRAAVIPAATQPFALAPDDVNYTVELRMRQ